MWTCRNDSYLEMTLLKTINWAITYSQQQYILLLKKLKYFLQIADGLWLQTEV